MRRTTRRFPATLALLCSVLSLVPATAQTPAVDPQIAVTVSSFTPWIDGARPFRLNLAVRNTGSVPVEEVTLFLRVYARARSRSELRAALDGRPQRGADIGSSTIDGISQLSAGEETEIAVDRDAEQMRTIASAFGPNRDGGVYPMRLEVRGSDRSLWEAWTALVFLPPAKGESHERLNLTWILPFEHPYMAEPDASFRPAIIDKALAPRGTLLQAARVFADIRALPMTVTLSGVTMDELEVISDGYTRRDGSRTIQTTHTDAIPRAATEALTKLNTMATSNIVEIAASPYANADLATLSHAGMEADARRQLEAGYDSTRSHIGKAPNAAVLVPGAFRLDQRSAGIAAESGAKAVVLDPDLLEQRRGIFGPDEPVVVTGRGATQFTALLVDRPIRERLDDGDGDDVLRAQAVLAETASAWFERPAIADERTLIVASSAMPPAKTIATLADGLATAPWLQMMSASKMLATVAADEDPKRLPLLGADPTSLERTKIARRAVDVLSRIIVEPKDATKMLDRLVLASEAAGIVGRSRSAEIARGAQAQTDRFVQQVTTTARRVTLTSRNGKLPVTVLNGTPYKVRVEVRLSSAKVVFPEGSVRIVEIDSAAGPQTPAATTITIPARARAAGAFGVRIQLRTPDGAIPIGAGSLTIRSTAVSAVALIVIGGSVLVMLGTWVRRGGHRKRKKAPGSRNAEQPGKTQPA